jgi:hypothetical protein
MSRWLDAERTGQPSILRPKNAPLLPFSNEMNHYVTIDVVTKTARLGDQDTKPAVLSHGQDSRP